MKTLYLIRHAKSSWKFPALHDFDRPLNRRGKHDAPMMGQRLRQRYIVPDLILCSPAKRTKRTAQAIGKAVGYPTSAIIYPRAIYEASAEEMIKILQAIDDRINTVMLVAHNPGLTELANRLTAHYIDNVVTTGVVAIQFSVTHWKEIADVPGQFLWYDYPKLQH